MLLNLPDEVIQVVIHSLDAPSMARLADTCHALICHELARVPSVTPGADAVTYRASHIVEVLMQRASPLPNEWLFHSVRKDATVT